MSESPVLPHILLASAIEKVLNRLISMDDFHPNAFQPFEDKVFAVALREMGENRPFYLIFHNQRVAVQTQLTGEPDAIIITDLYSLKRLPERGNLMRVDISGDVALAEQLIDAFAQLEIDWEERLSRYTGDLIAFQIGHAFRRLQSFKSQQREQLGDTLKEYLQFEINLLPTRHQVAGFSKEVTELKNETDALDQRLARLEALLLPQPSLEQEE
jgi:ubiquinone biosynthesis protein UbiJ